MTAVLCLSLVLLEAEVDHPPLTEAEWLPPPEELLRLYNCSYRYRRHLETTLEFWPDFPQAERFREAITETRYLEEWFDLAHGAAEPAYREEYRRACLDQLRRRYPDWYYRRVLPPCVPYWRLPTYP